MTACHQALGRLGLQATALSSVCRPDLPPVVLLCGLLSVLVALSAALLRAGLRLFRYVVARRSAAFVASGVQALTEYQRAVGGSGGSRPSRHVWYSPVAIEAPICCSVCFQPATAGARACELCGVVAHAACCGGRHVPCRQLADAPSPLQHHWLPAGTRCELWGELEDQDEKDSALCLLCGGACAIGLLAVAPVWQCSACRCGDGERADARSDRCRAGHCEQLSGRR